MLLEHNIPVYKKLKETLTDIKDTVIVTATGTGKSYLMDEYINEFDMKALIICPTIGMGEDWYKLSDRVSCITYHRFHRYIDEYIKNINEYDIYIFDEAHRTGAKEWGKSINKFKDKCNKPIVGLTATPVRYTDNCRDIIIEMFDGSVVHGYSIKEALDEGILPNINYICALYDTTGIKEKIPKDVSKELIGRLDLCIQNTKRCVEIIKSELTEGKNKGIIFVDRIESIESGINIIKEAFPNEKVWSIHSKQSNRLNSQYINEFNKSSHGYIISVNILNEGKHANGIDTIIMLRKTSSPTVFIQQIGRGFSVNGKDVKIFDFVSNHLSIDVVKQRQELIHRLASSTPKTTKKSSQLILTDYTGEFYTIIETIESLDGRLYWSTEEDEILKKYYPTEGGKVAKRLPGRSIDACTGRAIRLRLTYSKSWSAEEDEILKKYYPTEGVKVAKRLPGRTGSACKAKAGKLNIEYINNIWSTEEDEIIKNYYPTEGGKVAKRLPSRTEQACVQRAYNLNIEYINNIWSTEEDEILKKYYATEKDKVIQRLSNKTKWACKQRIKELNITITGSMWTENEENILKQYYPTEGVKVAKRLPGRTEQACALRANSLGVVFTLLKSWSTEEDEIIKNYYPTEGKDVVKRLPGRSIRACISRACKLGIKVKKKAE